MPYRKIGNTPLGDPPARSSVTSGLNSSVMEEQCSLDVLTDNIDEVDLTSSVCSTRQSLVSHT